MLKFSQSRDKIMYLVAIDLEKKSDSTTTCGRSSDILDELFPEIVILTNGLGILQNICYKLW